MVALIRIHRVGNDSIRSTFAEEVITILYFLSAEDLLIRKEDASVMEVRKEDTSKGEETYNGSWRRPAVGLQSLGPLFHRCRELGDGLNSGEDLVVGQLVGAGPSRVHSANHVVDLVRPALER